MPIFFPSSLLRTFSKSINKSLIGFIPAVLTHEALQLMFTGLKAEKWSNAVFACLTILYNRLGESAAKFAFAEDELQTLYIADEARCSKETAQLFITGKLNDIAEHEQENLKTFLTTTCRMTVDEAEKQFVQPNSTRLKSLISKAADYDVFKMIIAGLVCYYMPIPTANPLYARIFNSAVASGSNYAIGLISRNVSCQFFNRSIKAQEEDLFEPINDPVAVLK